MLSSVKVVYSASEDIRVDPNDDGSLLEDG